MRGNQPSVLPKPHNERSIPAYAGEPPTLPSPIQYRPVYPRVCGGTVTSASSRPSAGGLSPRMRGNRAVFGLVVPFLRSIPAYAGEPPRSGFGLQNQGVYPRVCGGTAFAGSAWSGAGGLSPRMRGNQTRASKHGGYQGSIPAYAGEPVRTGRGYVHNGVYPRVCGGTLLPTSGKALLQGLSPRMRGNPRNSGRIHPCGWSIPAYAGEPSANDDLQSALRVYPRVCGGTPPLPS